jgi:hypothetical protein
VGVTAAAELDGADRAVLDDLKTGTVVIAAPDGVPASIHRR